jgi:hypothetical protein
MSADQFCVGIRAAWKSVVVVTIVANTKGMYTERQSQMYECANCGHDEGDHHEQSTGETICLGAGKFNDGSPQCDCDLFEDEQEEEEEDDE